MRVLVVALLLTIVQTLLAPAAFARAPQPFAGASVSSAMVSPIASSAQAEPGMQGAAVGEALASRTGVPDGSLDGGASEPSIAGDDGRLSSAVEIALLLTVLSLLPAILITLTSFTRIVIVLSFVRRALSLNELPPNPVLIGLALFLTLFVMAPVGERLYEESWAPYERGEIAIEDAADSAWSTLSTFLVANTRQSELSFFAELAGSDRAMAYASAAPLDEISGLGDEMSVTAVPEPGDLPLTVVVPSFILSELKTAFQMGFLLFLPFLVIDLVVASVLLSMGMFMLPPVMISTPIKILLFVLVDGWRLVTESLVTSFVQVSGG